MAFSDFRWPLEKGGKRFLVSIGCGSIQPRPTARRHTAAETIAMHRMKSLNLSCLAVAATALLTLVAAPKIAEAQPPRVVQADLDFAASGYVTPAGMAMPTMYQGMVGALAPNTMAPNVAASNSATSGTLPYGNVVPVGFQEPACDSADFGGRMNPLMFDGGCDGCGEMGCDGGCGGGLFSGGFLSHGCDSCGDGGCDGECEEECDGGIFGCCGCSRCRMLGRGGFLGRFGNRAACGGCAQQGCPYCGGLTNLRHMCLFCRGGGCEACQFLGRGYLLGALRYLLPYRDAGRCAQRWYDLSLEGVGLTHNNVRSGNVLTTRGTGAGAVPVLFQDDADASFEAGMRASVAMILGVGGNLEFTYMGTEGWDNNQTVTDPNANLFSFISDFGVFPGAGGFDDTDRSLSQSVSTESKFQSFELNYRRRTVGPYCRFQGSWLVGLRHLRFEDRFDYTTVGTVNNTGGANLLRFFSSSDRAKNRLFGPQAGFDVWYNMIPGVNLGFGAKGAWMQNDINRLTSITANSIAAGATPGTVRFDDGFKDTTVMGELEATMLYRLSHSWTVKTSYYMIAAQDIAFGTIEKQPILDFVDGNANTQAIQYKTLFDDLIVHGFGIGAEYIW